MTLVDRSDRRRRVALGAALASLIAMPLAKPGAAHEGHDHVAQRHHALASGETPRRLADGTVYIPKATQRLLGLRTRLVEIADQPQSREVSGRLVADPDTTARLAAPRDGRIEPGDKGLPFPGRQVGQGDALAFLVPSLSAFEEAQLRQRQSEIEKELALLLPRSAHLGVVNPNMPMGDATVQLLQEMQIQAEALTRQGEVIKQTLAARIPLEAPIAGTIAEARLARGQSVTRGQTLIEIVDRKRARVEAFGFGDVPSAIAGASAVTADGRALKLDYLGRGPVLRQQAVPLVFTVVGDASAFDLGQLVKVRIATRETTRGAALAAAAVQRGTAGGHIVWEQAGAEVYRPRTVTTRPGPGADVIVSGDIEAGMRVVVEGAVFIGQVR